LADARLSGFTDSLRDLALHDHLCWAYDRRDDLPGLLVEYLGDGVGQRQRICYLSAGDRDALRADLAGLPGLNRLVDTGAVKLMAVAESDAAHPVRAAEHIARIAGETEAALAEGYRGLRMAADCTTFAAGARKRDAFARFEHQLDCYVAAHPVTVLCLYDRSLLGAAATTELAAVHPLTQPAATPLRIFAGRGADLALAGEVDALGVALLERTLDRVQLPRDGRPVLVDATTLTFVDHLALRALDRWAVREDLALTVVNAGHLISRLAELVGLSHVRVVPR
jgi:hypothetical protein